MSVQSVAVSLRSKTLLLGFDLGNGRMKLPISTPESLPAVDEQECDLSKLFPNFCERSFPRLITSASLPPSLPPSHPPLLTLSPPFRNSSSSPPFLSLTRYTRPPIHELNKFYSKKIKREYISDLSIYLSISIRFRSTKFLGQRRN